eukprot:403365012
MGICGSKDANQKGEQFLELPTPRTRKLKFLRNEMSERKRVDSEDDNNMRGSTTLSSDINDKLKNQHRNRSETKRVPRIQNKLMIEKSNQFLQQPINLDFQNEQQQQNISAYFDDTLMLSGIQRHDSSNNAVNISQQNVGQGQTIGPNQHDINKNQNFNQKSEVLVTDEEIKKILTSLNHQYSSSSKQDDEQEHQSFDEDQALRVLNQLDSQQSNKKQKILQNLTSQIKTIDQIKSVAKVNYKIQDNLTSTNTAKRSDSKQYQFEIQLKESGNKIKNEAQTSKFQSPLKSRLGSAMQNKYQQQSSQLQNSFSARKNSQGRQGAQGMNSYRDQVMSKIMDQKLSQSTQKQKKLDMSTVAQSLNQKYKLQQKVQQALENTKQKLAQKTKLLNDDLSQIMQDSSIDNDSEFQRELEKSMQNPGDQIEISTRNIIMGAVSKSINNTASLTNRQMNMQESENRLIFVTQNENICDTWICLLNYLRITSQSKSNQEKKIQQ